MAGSDYWNYGRAMMLYGPYEKHSQQPRKVLMRKILLSLAAASAIAAAAPAAPASAMNIGTAAAIQAAIADEALVQDAAYVCRHRWRSSRRFCYWRPTYRRVWRRRW